MFESSERCGVVSAFGRHKLSKLFTDVNVTEFNYPKEAVSRPVRLLFGIAERLGLLSMFPMGYIIIARKV